MVIIYCPLAVDILNGVQDLPATQVPNIRFPCNKRRIDVTRIWDLLDRIIINLLTVTPAQLALITAGRGISAGGKVSI